MLWTVILFEGFVLFLIETTYTLKYILKLFKTYPVILPYISKSFIMLQSSHPCVGIALLLGGEIIICIIFCIRRNGVWVTYSRCYSWRNERDPGLLTWCPLLCQSAPSHFFLSNVLPNIVFPQFSFHGGLIWGWATLLLGKKEAVGLWTDWTRFTHQQSDLTDVKSSLS